MDKGFPRIADLAGRRIGGSDARIIMGNDQAALLRLWWEKRGEAGPEDRSGDLVVQVGVATEVPNRLWYERNTGQAVTAVQRRVQHPFLLATFDGMVEGPGTEGKFLLPDQFSSAERDMVLPQHDIPKANVTESVRFSVATGGRRLSEIDIGPSFAFTSPHAEASPPAFINKLDSSPLKRDSDCLNGLFGNLTPFFFKVDDG